MKFKKSIHGPQYITTHIPITSYNTYIQNTKKPHEERDVFSDEKKKAFSQN